MAILVKSWGRPAWHRVYRPVYLLKALLLVMSVRNLDFLEHVFLHVEGT